MSLQQAVDVIAEESSAYLILCASPEIGTVAQGENLPLVVSLVAGQGSAFDAKGVMETIERLEELLKTQPKTKSKRQKRSTKRTEDASGLVQQS